MNKHHLIWILSLGGLVVLGLSSGCGKKPEPPPPPKAEESLLQKQVEAAAAAGKEAAQKAVAGVTTAATQAVQAVAAQAGAAKAAATQADTDSSAKAQGIIDAARKLAAESKWEELGKTLGQLQGLKLTPEQEKSLLDLKQQLEKMVQEALNKQPAGGLPTGLLPKK